MNTHNDTLSESGNDERKLQSTPARDESRGEVSNLIASTRAFLAHFNPTQLAEGASQQWLATSHQCEVAEAAIDALTAERDAAFAMSRCECETNEACRNIAALTAERDRLRKRVERVEAPAQRVVEVYGKMEDGEGSPCPDIAALKAALQEESQ